MANWHIGKFIAAFLIAGVSITTFAAPDRTRGELLYRTQCQFCHTEEIHWRDKNLVTDWNSLISMVDRWQSNINLNWNAEDVVEVASYLNSVFYHFSESRKKQAALEKR